ncbi:MAG: hypothetical protein J1E83_14450 [Lachnospiraceae bacterium]|nr:hypothetical protein [Lachnospiraceae bacterium]
MGNMDYQREVNEAIQAASQALRSLQQAKESLKSAGNWGIWDMLGGGLISTFVKHSKMEDAERLVQQARSDLKRLQKELMDVDTVAEFHIETGDFLSFADYFFDGLIADWLVQSRINEAKRQVDSAIQKVEEVLRRLRAL